ncbi:ankyrin repeat domain protein [Nitzschia inconspicua]|uniref:Ankyrin repeat domain protein n=1 Tax=Nitzschia inconspicua TaxID=303405 RepID=A0A9K3KRI7_9STRA|nr:ankyrin repeat domain protein [Nitzschia inconspicua]
MVASNPNAVIQRQGSPSTTLETRSSEAPWIRDQRRTPRSARSLTSTPTNRKRQVPPASSSANPFEETPRRRNIYNNSNNPFESPDVIKMQHRTSQNPFDSPASNRDSIVTTTVTTVGGGTLNHRTINNPFESPSPSRMMIETKQKTNQQRTDSTINPFDSPALSTRPPVTPNRRPHSNRSPAAAYSPAKQESVALDSLEQILDTTDDTTQDEDEEVEVLTDGAQPQVQHHHSRNVYPYPPYSSGAGATPTPTTQQSPRSTFSPSPFRTPTPSEVVMMSTPSPTRPYSTTTSKQSQSTPPTTSSRSVESWADAISQDTTPSDRALRAAETLRRNFEHRRSKQKRGEEMTEEESTALDGLVLEYSQTEGSESANINDDVKNDNWNNNNNNSSSKSNMTTSSMGIDGFPEEKKQEMIGEEEKRESTPSVETPLSKVDSSNFALHDLCDEARSTDDLAWRNALYLLSVQPRLASEQETNSQMTPLHVACMATDHPPLWMTRALLYTAPSACRQTDKGGRLPLHLLVATSADVDTVRLLVEEYPPSVAHKDDRGFTPLHLLLKNNQVTLTLEHLRLLLGQISYGTPQHAQQGKRSKVSFRKGDHLKKNLEELEEMANERDQCHESTFRQYPDDVRRCLTKLSQWKRRQDHKQAHMEKRLHQENLAFMHAKGKDFENPASIPTPTGQVMPLHLLVRRNLDSKSPLDIYSVKEASRIDLMRVIVAAYPRALLATDAHGNTPLMTAMLQSYSLPSDEVVEILLGLRTPGFGVCGGEHPAMIPSGETGQLPLHVAAEELLSNYSLVSTICEAYPDARSVQDFRGRTPLHLAIQNYRSVPLDEATMDLLYIDSIAKVRDDDGKTPFDLLVENPKCVKEPFEPFLGTIQSSKVFQTFLDASMDRPRNGTEAQLFLQRFQNLPPWLRRQACAAVAVQDTLLKEMASPFNTFRILGSGLVLVVLLALLRRLLHVKEGLEVLVYYLATYHLVIQLIHWVKTIFMGECWRLCLSNIWRWIDLATGILAILCSHSLGSETGEVEDKEDYLSNLGAAATAACWLSLLGYLIDWSHGVAVFAGSATRVLSVLVCPLFVAAMGIVATSQIIFTLDDCTEGGICSLPAAYDLVYQMMLGEPALTSDSQFSLSMTVIVVIFTVLWIWWIFSAVAMTITEAKYFDRKQIAIVWFWEPKVVLTALTFGGRSGKLSNGPGLAERWCNTMEVAWDVLCSALYMEDSSKSWDMCCFRSQLFRFATGFLALFLVPIWLAMGLATLGLLWPPQVRRWVFTPSQTSTDFNGRHNANASEDELSRAKLSQLRADLVEMKAITYDQNYQIQKDLVFLKDVIFRAVMEEEDYLHSKSE